jgi:hypothetical protein
MVPVPLNIAIYNFLYKANKKAEATREGERTHRAENIIELSLNPNPLYCSGM